MTSRTAAAGVGERIWSDKGSAAGIRPGRSGAGNDQHAQGEDVVAGRTAAYDPDPLIAAVPGLAHELQSTCRTLEAIFGDAQDFEFTVQDGKLWLLQARAAKRTPWAALQIACDMVDEGLIDQATALDGADGASMPGPAGWCTSVRSSSSTTSAAGRTKAGAEPAHGLCRAVRHSRQSESR